MYKNLQLENLDGEIWKEIDGYDGDYFISNYGRVKSFKRKNVIILKQQNNQFYLMINLCKNGECKLKYTHILVYENFKNEKINNDYIHHIDLNIKNNYINNLLKMTREEHNNLHHKNKIVSEKVRKAISKTRKKRFKDEAFNLSGENNPRSILTKNDVIKIWKYLNEGILTQIEIAKLFGVKPITISNIKTGKTWK